MLECCKSIQMDGLVWGASKKVPIGKQNMNIVQAELETVNYLISMSTVGTYKD